MPTPSDLIIFTLGATSISVPGPSGPTDISPSPRFVTDLSANHTRWTYEVTTAQKYQWSIQISDLTEAQRANLQSFFESTARGPLNQFYYTHTDGYVWLVRFTDVVLKWMRVNGTQWGTSFVLELDDWTPTSIPTTTTAAPTTTTTAAP